MFFQEYIFFLQKRSSLKTLINKIIDNLTLFVLKIPSRSNKGILILENLQPEAIEAKEVFYFSYQQFGSSMLCESSFINI